MSLTNEREMLIAIANEVAAQIRRAMEPEVRGARRSQDMRELARLDREAKRLFDLSTRGIVKRMAELPIDPIAIPIPRTRK